MSHLNLIVQWLLYSRGRTVLTMLSVTAAFVLFGLLQGMNQGIDAYIVSMNSGRLLVTSRAALAAFLPASYVERIRRVRGVAAVTDMSFFGGYFREARNALPVYATDIPAFFAVYPQLEVSQSELREMAQLRAGAIISRPIALQFGWKVGDMVPIESSVYPNRDGTPNWPMTIAGIYELDPKTNLPNMVLMHYAYLDEGRTRMNGETNFYMVRMDGTRVPREIESEIDAQFANSDAETHTQSEADLARTQIQQAADIKLVADSAAGAVMFMLLFVTGNTMMQCYRERTGQLAVLRTIGFSPTRIVILVFGEAALLCVSSAVLGLAIAKVLFPIGQAAAFYPHSTLATITMPFLTAVTGVVIAGLLAMASALPAAWRAGHLNVIDALCER